MGKKEGQAGHGAAGNEKQVWPGLGCSVRPPTAVGKQGRAGPAAGRAASDFPTATGNVRIAGSGKQGTQVTSCPEPF